MSSTDKEHPKCFAIKLGEVNRRLNSDYYHPERIQAISRIYKKWDKQNRVALGDVLIFEETIRPYISGLPYIGLANIESGFGNYIETHEEEPEGTCRTFKKGQILYGRLRPYLNKVYIAQEDGQCSTEIYCLSVKNSSQLLHSFLSAFLMSKPFLLQTIHMMTGNTHPRILREDFEEILIPLPSLDIQHKLATGIEVAKESRRWKLQQAEELLSSLDEWLMERLGLTPAPVDERRFFALRLEQLRGHRIDVPAYHPFFAKGHPPKTPIASLSALSYIDTHVIDKPEDENELVPYVGLPECEQIEVKEVVMRPYHEVKGRSVVKPGDILFARIEPSIFNKKYVFVEDLRGHEYAYTSTEFYVVTPNRSEADPYYLYAMFFCSFVFNQVKGKTTGSSGRRRLDSELFQSLQFPKPSMKMQQTIAFEVRRRREEARRLRAEAEAEWEKAKLSFEAKLFRNRI